MPSRILLRETLRLRLWAFWNIRLISFVRPGIVALDDERCVLRVPLTRRTRNHLKSMYFGALCTGADAAAALPALDALRRAGVPMSVVFKDVRGEFFKRPEAEVHFTCAQVAQIRDLVEKAKISGERESLSVEVVATVPSLLGEEPVARFALTLSVKRKG